MRPIIIARVADMKYYKGITDKDKPDIRRYALHWDKTRQNAIVQIMCNYGFNTNYQVKK